MRGETRQHRRVHPLYQSAVSLASWPIAAVLATSPVRFPRTLAVVL